MNSMNSKFVAEKNRIFQLKVKALKTKKDKMDIINLFGFVPKSQKMIECENYYLVLDCYLQNKIDFWSGVIAGKMPPNMLPKLQESMTEWLECGWAYLGQEKIREESENAKSEFQFYKTIINRLKDKPKQSNSSRKK